MAAESLVEKHVRVFNDHDAEAWAGDYSENATVHDPQYPAPLEGRDAIRKDASDFFAAFPDIQFRTVSIVAGGDRVAIEGVGSGTHRGPMEGPAGTIPPTNKRAEVPYAAFVRVDSSGLITEERRYYDLAGMMQQLGLMSQ